MQALASDGFAILRDVFSEPEVSCLIDSLAAIDQAAGVRSRGGVYAVRNLLELSPAVDRLAASQQVKEMAEVALGRNVFVVRGLLFDKTPSANWIVPWHQDLTIAVADKADVPDYGPWTRKAGVWHVQPPVDVLEQMVSVRIHLDACDELNGALRVLPATHGLGRLSTAQIAEQQSRVAPVVCAADAGDVLVMKPLLLHASSAANQASHRRVIHLDFAGCQLDGGLIWSTQKHKRRRIAPAPS